MFFGGKIYKYLSFYFVKTIAIFCLGISAMILLIDLTENIRKYNNNDKISILEIIFITLLKLPNLLLEISPFIVLFASLFCIRSIVLRKELDIFRACGISIWKCLTPFLVVAFVYGVVIVLLVSPLSTLSLNQLIKIEESGKEQTDIVQVSDQNVWIILQSGYKEYILLSKQISKDKFDYTILNTVSMYEIENSKVNSMFVASSGLLKDRNLKLFDVIERSKNDNFPQQKSEISFDTNKVGKGITSLNLDSNNILLWDLPKIIKSLKILNLSYKHHVVYFINLITQPLFFLTMVFVSVRFSLLNPRAGKNIYIIFIVILIGLFLYFLNNFLGVLGISGFVDPAIVVISSKIILLLFAINLLFSKEGL